MVHSSLWGDPIGTDEDIMAGLRVLAEKDPEMARSLVEHTRSEIKSEDKPMVRELSFVRGGRSNVAMSSSSITESEAPYSTEESRDEATSVRESPQGKSPKRGFFKRFQKKENERVKKERQLRELSGAVTTYQSKSRKANGNAADQKDTKHSKSQQMKEDDIHSTTEDVESVKIEPFILSDTLAGLGDKINGLFGTEEAATEAKKVGSEQHGVEREYDDHSEKEEDDQSRASDESSASQYSESSREFRSDTSGDEGYDSSSVSSRESVHLAGNAGPPEARSAMGPPSMGSATLTRRPSLSARPAKLTRRPSLRVETKSSAPSGRPPLSPTHRPPNPSTSPRHAAPRSPLSSTVSTSLPKSLPKGQAKVPSKTSRPHRRPPVTQSRFNRNRSSSRPAASATAVSRVPSQLQRDDESVSSKTSRISRMSRISRFSRISRASRASQNITKKNSWEQNGLSAPLDQSFDDGLSGVFDTDGRVKRNDTFDDMETGTFCCC